MPLSFFISSFLLIAVCEQASSRTSGLKAFSRKPFLNSTTNYAISSQLLWTFVERSSDFQHCVRTFQTIPQSQFVVDVRERLRSIWYQAKQLGNLPSY